jgi:hypothetical protein
MWWLFFDVLAPSDLLQWRYITRHCQQIVHLNTHHLIVLASLGHLQKLSWEHYHWHCSTRHDLGHQGCHWLQEMLPSIGKMLGMNIWLLKSLPSGRFEIMDLLTNKNAKYTLLERY